MVEKAEPIALPIIQGLCEGRGSAWDMCLPTSIEIHEIGSPLCLSYHCIESSRTLWHTVLETNHKRVLSLTYCDHEKGRTMIVRQDDLGQLSTDILIGNLQETALGGRLPPNLLGADNFPTRNHKHIRGIHHHFQRLYKLAGV